MQMGNDMGVVQIQVRGFFALGKASPLRAGSVKGLGKASPLKG